MARYAGSVCRLCRREGVKLFLKGERCMSDKCSFTRRPDPPGPQKPGRWRRGVSNYGLQLREKQKVRRIYGVLERQFRNYFRKAERMPGMTGENLLSLLERRLDNVIYKLGWATSRIQARQLVNHRHIMVDGKVVNIPSFLVEQGNSISLHRRRRIEEVVRDSLKVKGQQRVFPDWLKADSSRLEAKVIRIPAREDIDHEINEELIVALYSK
ncbi:TPA: 30S ribosomal protein S4 [bacterium]|nr:30S ribosomal protein S4 [bacterium]